MGFKAVAAVTPAETRMRVAGCMVGGGVSECRGQYCRVYSRKARGRPGQAEAAPCINQVPPGPGLPAWRSELFEAG